VAREHDEQGNADAKGQSSGATRDSVHDGLGRKGFMIVLKVGNGESNLQWM
jgi:hypothetical protein